MPPVCSKAWVKTAMFLLACLLLIDLPAGCASFSKADNDDDEYNSAITNKVRSAIENDFSLEMAQIDVETYKGVVQLSGFVASPDDIRKAGDLAAAIPGIISVKNDLVVKNMCSVLTDE